MAARSRSRSPTRSDAPRSRRSRSRSRSRVRLELATDPYHETCNWDATTCRGVGCRRPSWRDDVPAEARKYYDKSIPACGCHCGLCFQCGDYGACIGHRGCCPCPVRAIFACFYVEEGLPPCPCHQADINHGNATVKRDVLPALPHDLAYAMIQVHQSGVSDLVPPELNTLMAERKAAMAALPLPPVPVAADAPAAAASDAEVRAASAPPEVPAGLALRRRDASAAGRAAAATAGSPPRRELRSPLERRHVSRPSM